MLYVVLVVLTLAVVALGAWTVRRQARMERTLPCSNDRLGIRDPRDLPYGPPSSL